MSEEDPNPYRSPTAETSEATTRVQTPLRRKVFGVVALFLGMWFGFISVASLVAFIALAWGFKNGFEPRTLPVVFVMLAVAFWLIRLGRRELKGGR